MRNSMVFPLVFLLFLVPVIAEPVVFSFSGQLTDATSTPYIADVTITITLDNGYAYNPTGFNHWNVWSTYPIWPVTFPHVVVTLSTVLPSGPYYCEYDSSFTGPDLVFQTNSSGVLEIVRWQADQVAGSDTIGTSPSPHIHSYAYGPISHYFTTAANATTPSQTFYFTPATEAAIGTPEGWTILGLASDLQSVPEPATLFLLVGGLAGLGLIRRRL